MSVQSVGQVVQSVKLFAGNGVGSSKDLIFIDFVGLCSWKKSKKACSSSSLRISVNGSNVQRSFLGSRKNWASFIKSVLDLERANSASQQSSDLKPKAANLEDILSERGAFGVGFIANLDKKASHEIVNDALTAFGCMEYRGGFGTDNDSGDDSGLMTSIPWELVDNWANEPL